MVCLAASEEQIKRLTSLLSKDMYRGFRDEDLDNMLTAVAFRPMNSELGKQLFGDLKLA